MKSYFKLVFVLLIALFVSCNADDPAVPQEDESVLIRNFLDSMGINAEEGATGLFYYPVTLNPAGKTQAEGKVLSIYYTLTVLGGDTIVKYDSARGAPFVLKQGVNAIYPLGFDEALGMMKEGEEWGFIFPSPLAYGNLSFSTLIPENAIIEAKIKLLEIRNENDVLADQLTEIEDYVEDNNLRDTVENPLNPPKSLPQGLGMVYKRIREGAAGTKPIPGNLVTLKYEMKNIEGNPVDTKGAAGAFEFEVDGNEVISGLNIGVKQMQEGERALFICPSAVAYSYSAAVIPDFANFKQLLAEEEIIPTYAVKVNPYDILLVDLELIDIK